MLGNMESALDHSLAERLSDLWAALHKTVEMTVSANEIHYLRTVALTLDDDLASSLLLKKLRLATATEETEFDSATVRMNSFLEFTHDGSGKRFCQLVHPSDGAPNYGVAITSLLGVGLLGLRAGQTILWPDERGALCDLSVSHVENRPGNRL